MFKLKCRKIITVASTTLTRHRITLQNPITHQLSQASTLNHNVMSESSIHTSVSKSGCNYACESYSKFLNEVNGLLHSPLVHHHPSHKNCFLFYQNQQKKSKNNYKHSLNFSYSTSFFILSLSIFLYTFHHITCYFYPFVPLLLFILPISLVPHQNGVNVCKFPKTKLKQLRGRALGRSNINLKTKRHYLINANNQQNWTHTMTKKNTFPKAQITKYINARGSYSKTVSVTLHL